MSFKIKIIGLAIGLLCVVFSFLLFARENDMYMILWTFGCFISVVFYLMVLFGRHSIKLKFFTTLIVLFGVLFQRVTEEFLIRQSYLIYLKKHNNELTEINKILSSIKGDVNVYPDEVDLNPDQLNLKQDTGFVNIKNRLLDLRKKSEAYTIFKDDSSIYYGIWGFLDVRLGVTYFYNEEKIPIRYKYLRANWYY